jgi:hypothetical protein
MRSSSRAAAGFSRGGRVSKPTFRAVEVRWVDSCHRSGWEAMARRRVEQQVSECRSVGYLLDRNADRIRLVQSVDETLDSAAEGLTIPMCAVRSVRKLT